MQQTLTDQQGLALRRWSIVPLLTCAGFVSGVCTILFTVLAITIPNEYQLALIGSISLGLTVSAALWSLGFIRSWKTVATLVAATVASHFIYLFAIEEGLLSLNKNVMLPLVGTVQPPLFATFSLIALVLYSAFVVVLVPGRKKLWAPVIALVSAPPAALCVSYIDAHGSIIWNGTMLAPLWQTVLAGFLGVALTLARVDLRPPGKRFAVLYVLAGYFLVFGTLSCFASTSDRKRIDENDKRLVAKVAARLAAAPSRDNLPYMGEQFLDRVLLMDGVGDWRPDRSGATEMPAEPHQGKYAAEAPRPERIEYYVRYSRIALVPEDARWLRAMVTQYPNAAWAEYEVFNGSPLFSEVQSLTRFGSHLRQEGTRYGGRAATC